MFICGSGSLNHQDDHDGSPCPTPKRTKKSTSFCKILGRDNSNKNPYADRGLDKFYALLADLDDKKQLIYTQKGSEDISFVRFVYTDDSNRIKPIVIKAKEKKHEKSSSDLISKKSFKSSTSNINQDDVDQAIVTTAASQSTAEVPKREPVENPQKKRRCFRCNESFQLDNLRQPPFYCLVIVFLTLLFLAMYGRSFAILCTTIVWYVCPTVVGGNSSSSSSSSSSSWLPNERKPKRKEYERKQSFGKKINVHNVGPSSPKSVISGLMEIK